MSSSKSSKPAIFDLHDKGLLPLQNFIVAILGIISFYVIAFHYPNIFATVVSIVFEIRPVSST